MSISKIQERDSCLALVFLVLLIWLFLRQQWLVYLAMGILLLGMIWPAAMRPFAFCWFGLSHFLGKIVSTILLAVIWLVMVVPVGLLRRMLGRDSLHLKQFRAGGSAFVVRDHLYTADDLKNPY